MILGLSTPTFTLIHVIISLIGVVSGFIVLFGMFGSHRLPGWTALFLFTTLLTSVTGFLFPATKLTPAGTFGIISLVVMVPTLLALYAFHLRGLWRLIYVGGAVILLFLNSFVVIAQSFLKIPLIHPLAPTASEPPFLVAEGVLFAIFVVLGLTALIKFHPERHAAA
jgi:hypothetical protein